MCIAVAQFRPIQFWDWEDFCVCDLSRSRTPDIAILLWNSAVDCSLHVRSFVLFKCFLVTLSEGFRKLRRVFLQLIVTDGCTSRHHYCRAVTWSGNILGLG
jgi:hypothetical protein